MNDLPMEDLVYVGFNKQVIALDRFNGTKVWEWKSPEGAGFPAILVDGDRLIVSVTDKHQTFGGRVVYGKASSCCL